MGSSQPRSARNQGPTIERGGPDVHRKGIWVDLRIPNSNLIFKLHFWEL